MKILSPVADMNVPLAAIAAHKREKRRFIEDCRRERVMLENPNTPRKSAWKVEGKDAPPSPAWTFERGEDGLVTLARQERPRIDSIDSEAKFIGRRYLLEMHDACFVGGELVPAGAKVDAFADAAFSLNNLRGKIILEYKI